MKTRYLTATMLLVLGCYGAEDTAVDPAPAAGEGGGAAQPGGGESASGGGDAGAADPGGGGGGSVACSVDDDCDDGSACTVDYCSEGVCAVTSLPMDDGDSCTVDYCDAQTGPHHLAVDVDDGDPCTLDVCSHVGISHDATFWVDGDICTIDSCDSQTGQIAHDLVDIDDGNACTLDSCMNPYGVQHSELMCDDADECTEDLCSSSFGCHFPPIVYFDDDFTHNLGWTFGGPQGIFAIDVAKPSNVTSPGFMPDPADDHSPSADRKLLGAVIGGPLPLEPDAGMEWAESPTIDVSKIPTELWLDFWAELNLEGRGYDASVEVFDGHTWQRVVYYDYPVVEHGYSHYSIDVTAYMNEKFAIRFAHSSTGEQTGLSVAGWSVDDVRLLPYGHCL